MAISKALKRDKKTLIIAGLTKHYDKKKTLTLKGKRMVVGDIITKLQTSIAAGIDTDAKRTDYLEAAQTSREANAAIDPIVLTLTDFLLTTKSAKDLSDFGLAPRTRAEPDVETKQTANTKRAATRKARNIVGPKQRAKIVATPADTSAATPPVTADASSTPPSVTPKPPAGSS